MNRASRYSALLLMIFSGALRFAQPAFAQDETRELSVTVGKSTLVDSPVNVIRIVVANPDLLQAFVVSPRELVLNGKQAGVTSLTIWQQNGSRLSFDVNVLSQVNRIDLIRAEMAKEFTGQDITISMEGGNVFLRGTAASQLAADRAIKMASVLGAVVNLMNVKVPPMEPQILIKVRFADVDRGASSELGANLISQGAFNTTSRITTQAFSPPDVQANGTSTFSDLLNIFLFRNDLNIGATIRALENKRMLQILAEPNVLAINGKTASFLAGGEFPFPNLQGGGSGLGSVTVQFREFGIRINFTPTITPRGTIRLQVTPEVSSLDYANGLVFQGITIPGLSTRRVSTEIELEAGQSFAIGGLLDNRLTETYSKVPGIGDLPIIGKLFRSRSFNRNKSELLVIVSPELVNPIPKNGAVPEIIFPKEYIQEGRQTPPRTPGPEGTAPVVAPTVRESVPYEQLIESQKSAPTAAATAPSGLVQYVPVPLAPNAPPASAPPAAAPPAAAAPQPGN